MTSSLDATLLTRRIDRLRSDGAGAARADPGRTHDYAQELARSLAGRAVGGAAGTIVRFEHEVRISVDRTGLSALPYGVPVDAPLYCLDLETTGLATSAGTLAFLVGIGEWQADIFRVTQLVLPDHADESTLLDLIATALPQDAWLVTYNGRCFDWPLMVARYRLHRRSPPPLAGHFDLLPVARQLWKHRLGGARLATVESAICGVVRIADLPGALVPDRYFGYLRSRDSGLLADVIDHNRQDIVSLGLLVATLGNVGSRLSWNEMHPGDLFGLARTHARRGRATEALDCVEAALSTRSWAAPLPAAAVLRRQLAAERARLLARLGRREEAIAAWLEIAQRGGPGAGPAWLHVARYREHVARDFDAASAACHEAAAIAGRARAWGHPLFAVERDLERRLVRLARRRLRDHRARRNEPAISRAA